VGGDEGYYGTMARNVLASPRQAVSTSLTPLGAAGDKPPLVPILIAPFVRAWGPTPAAPRAILPVCAALVAWGIGRIVREASGPRTALFATALLATLPWFADASRGAAAEIPLTAFAALALVLLAGRRDSRARLVLAGALLGLGFLCKLWLVAPAALAAAAMVAGRDREALGRLAWLAGTAFAVASLHLVAVAVWAPADLQHWSYIYLGRSLAERVAGEGYAEYWRRPPGAYWATVTRAFGLVLPLVAAGVESAWRRRREPVPRALLVWAAGLLLMSAFRVKSGGYAYTVVPAFAGLAALGALAFARREGPHPITLALGALLTSPVGARWEATALPTPVWAAVWCLAVAIAVLVRVQSPLARKLVVAWAIAAVAIGAGRSVLRLAAPYHRPGYARIAASLAPAFAGVPPERRSLVAPEAPVFAYHLFRTAGYWGTPITPWTAERFAQVRADTALRAYVVDPSRSFYGGWPDSATMAWLEREMREVPRRAWGGGSRPEALRVFLRPGLPYRVLPAAPGPTLVPVAR
jgi:4-amino-4-deoxy-L-arabinose transferase-like glycosyltransferase